MNKETHENYSEEDGLSDCPGCPDCCPYDYRVEVDYAFLRTMKNMFQDLCSVSPERTAPGWKIQIEDYIEEALKDYKK